MKASKVMVFCIIGLSAVAAAARAEEKSQGPTFCIGTGISSMIKINYTHHTTKYQFGGYLAILGVRGPEPTWFELNIDYFFLRPVQSNRSKAYGIHLNFGFRLWSEKKIVVHGKVGLGYMWHQILWENYYGRTFWQKYSFPVLNLGVDLEYALAKKWGLRVEGVSHTTNDGEGEFPMWMTFTVGLTRRF